MTDHRVTDLSYGLLGKASYDTEEKKWDFSVDTDQKSIIHQLSPLAPCLPNSIGKPQLEDAETSRITRTQLKWLHKAHPQAFPASSITAAYLRSATVSRVKPPSSASLLAASHAYDANRISGSRFPKIVALPDPDGDALLLVRPRPEVWGWGWGAEKKVGSGLELFNLKASDYARWSGVGGGTIRQIVFTTGEEESKRWLAVRQDRITTIFRPTFGTARSLAVPSRASKSCPPSRIHPNLIVALPIEKTSSLAHKDVAFNPWYSRQFAVIDSKGCWSIWNIENVRGTELLKSGKRGRFSDDPPFELAPGPKMASEDHADGWYRVLWACNLNTIVLCNRYQLAVFDIENTPSSRVQEKDFLPKNNKEWILDIKLSSSNAKHVYVLTTSRVFWVEISSADDGAQGAKVILSYRHFRDANDETMKLTLVQDENVSVTITSEQSLLVNFYCFSISPSGSAISWKGAFNLQDDPEASNIPGVQSICLLSIRHTDTRSKRSADSNKVASIDPNTKIFQILVLDPHLQLCSALCAIRTSERGSIEDTPLQLTAPTRVIAKYSRYVASQEVDDHFIVPEGMLDDAMDQEAVLSNRSVLKKSIRTQDDLRYRINWKNVCSTIYPVHVPRNDEHERTPMPDILARVLDHLQNGVDNESLASSTIAEMSNFSKLSGDLHEVRAILEDFLATLRLDEGPEFPAELIVSDLTTGPESLFGSKQEPGHSDLMKIYDYLVDVWLASLPVNVSNATRGAKFKVIRKLAFELCMNSLALSLQNKETRAKNPMPTIIEEIEMQLDKDVTTTRDSSPALFSSQLAALPAHRSEYNTLPTPAQTPSLYSHATSGSELKEDPAITRLRQYAVSIRAKPDLGKPAILSQWPSSPGHDPAEYSWEAAQKAMAGGEEDEVTQRRIRKEDARRRRRTEKFLSQERARAAGLLPSSQPMVPVVRAPFSSQPVVVDHHSFSSQPFNNVPMTQPVGSIFGSRDAPKVIKKNKRRAAGF